MVSRYPSNAVPRPKPGPRAPSPSRPDSPGRGTPAGPGRGYSQPLPSLPKGQMAKLGAMGALRLIAPRLVPYVGWAWTAYDLWQMFNQPAYVNTSGWTLTHECGTQAPYTIYPAGWRPNVAWPGTACWSFASPYTINPQPKAVHNTAVILAKNPGGLMQSVTQTYYAKTVPNTVVPLIFPKTTVPIVDPFAPPAWPPNMPQVTPIGRPDPGARPNPARNPWEEPTNPVRKPVPRVRPRRRPDSRPRRDSRPVYDLPPVEGPLIRVNAPPTLSVLPHTTVIRTVGGRPQVSTKPSRAQDRRPPRRVKQKKVNIAITAGLLWVGINTVTEALDFIKAAEEALPKKLRLSDKASKAQKIEYMMSNPELWDSIDTAEFIQNYINMQVGDFVAALGSDSIKKVYKQSGMVTGLDRALRQVQDGWNDAAKEELTKQGGDPEEIKNVRWDRYVPQLDIDEASGSVTLTSPHRAVSFNYRSYLE